MRWMTDGASIAAAVMLYDASVSDAGDGNEVDDKEIYSKKFRGEAHKCKV